MQILTEYRHCWKGLHVYPKTKRQCPHCRNKHSPVPTCTLPPDLKICRKGLHLYPVDKEGCIFCARNRTKDWYQDNKERHYQNTANWIKKNQEKRREIGRKWSKNNRPKANAIAATRRARKKSQTPAWANLKEIARIYRECPEGYHVDHIYPLKSPVMCGLHVENNLQYLPALDNMRKGNRITLEQQLNVA